MRDNETKTDLGILDSYELSPTQQGMLFHYLDQHSPGVDIEQIEFILTERFDEVTFLQAWEQITNRHQILRTRFTWENTAQPQQDVCKSVKIPVIRHDWTSFEKNDIEAGWLKLKQDDRKQGFDLSKAPLLRLTLVKCAPDVFYILWTFHHILLDGRSFPIVLRELFGIYDAAELNEVPSLPPTRPYRDYIYWLRELDLKSAESFWRSELAGFHAPTPLVISRAIYPQPSKPEIAGECERMIPADTLNAINTFTQRFNITLNTLLQGAWSILLHRYSGEEDILFGATRACRRSSIDEADKMVGLFINTLPVRVEVKPNLKAVDVLKNLRYKQIRLRDYEHTPLFKVQSWSEVPGGQPLFESILVFDNLTLDAALLAEDSVPATRKFHYRGQTNYPLTLIGYGGNELLLRIEYDQQRFDYDCMMLLMGHLKNLLISIISAPETRVRDLNLLSDTERDSVLYKWNIEQSYPKKYCLHQLFEAQVKFTPEAVAVSFEDQYLTYNELNQKANQLAFKLQQLGSGKNVFVGLCVERSIEMVVGIIGILKSGCAYVPLDPAYPKDRLKFMIDDAQMPIVVTQRNLSSEFSPNNSAYCVYLDDLEATLPTCNVASTVEPDSIAYVIYTSGSTGKPKGVLVTHQNVVRLFKATDDWFHFGENDVWTLFHSYAFDFSVWELWGALLHGGRLVVVPYWISRSPDAFLELLFKEKVTVLNQTPSAFRQLVHAEQEDHKDPDLALRFVIFGGEALELQSLRPWFDRHGDNKPLLVNMYGITETTVHVTYRPIKLADLESGIGSVIGVPIPDLQVYILDDFCQPLPIGVPGELYVGGGGVSRGYLNRDELTDERFISDPFRDQHESRLYKTGDLARRLYNGDIEYLGRIDFQVQLRGFRVELGEIETNINQHHAVRESVVLTQEFKPGDIRLVAYIIAMDDEENVIDDLRSRLHDKLPEYMVPNAFIFMDVLPLNENGKVDRKNLPMPDLGLSESSRSYSPPRNSLEELLSEIWCSILAVDNIGIHDNFFELGGDSILSIQVVSRFRQLGFEITPRDLFRNPTVAQIATLNFKKVARDYNQANNEPTAGEVTLTPIQHWFFEQNFTNSHHWNQSFLFETHKDVNLHLLEEALTTILQHHDGFQLRFTHDPSGWRQYYVEDAEKVVLHTEDLSKLSQSDQTSAIAYKSSQHQTSLDLSAGPLLKVVYFTLGPDQPGQLLIVIHHLIIDGVSWRILLEDFELAYQALMNDSEIKLPAKTASYQSWSRKLIEYARSAEARDSYDTWLACIKGPKSKLPRDIKGTGNNNEDSTQTIAVRLSIEKTKALLHAVPAAYHSKINDILLTALFLTIAEWTGNNDLLIDMEGHGREEIFTDIDLSRTVGWFTTIFPARLRVNSTKDHGENIKAVKEQLRNIPNRGLSYGVLRYLGESEDTSRTLRKHSGSDILFNYLGQFDQVVANSSLFKFAPNQVDSWHSPQAHRPYMIEILSLILDQQLEIRWIFSKNLHKAETINQVADNFLKILEELINHCTLPDVGGFTPSDFPIAKVNQSQLDFLLERYSNTSDIYPLSPMQQLFYSMETASSRLGLEQWQFLLKGPVDNEVFRKSWEIVLAQHPILRSSFVSQGLDCPHQVVLHQVSLPWKEYDWHDNSLDSQKQRLHSLIEADSKKGFDLSNAPLMRLTLVKLNKETYHLIWTTHHLLIDGWSWPLIFRSLAEAYKLQTKDKHSKYPEICTYREYIEWLQNTPSEDEEFWRNKLEGFATPTPLIFNSSPSPTATPEAVTQITQRLSSLATKNLIRFARNNQLTLSTVVQGAWALLLSHYSDCEDVIFGAAFSGRPPEVAGIEGMVGPCVNNLPVRVKITLDETVNAWLLNMQKHQFELTQHQYTSLQQIQEWSEVPWRMRLFDSLLVFQNYLSDAATQHLSEDITIQAISVPESTNYPLTITITPEPELLLKTLYLSNRFEHSEMERFLDDFAMLIMTIPDSSKFPLAKLFQAIHQDSRGKAKIAKDTAARIAQKSASCNTPISDMEKKIADIWKDLFQLKVVDVDTNFFDLGGHSLLLIRAHNLLRTTINNHIPIVSLLQYPTIRSLATHLSKSDTRRDESPNIAYERALKRQKSLLKHKLLRQKR